MKHRTKERRTWKRGKPWRVGSGELLASEIEAAVKRRGASALARETGLSRAQLWRLRRGKVRWVYPETLRQIEKAVLPVPGRKSGRYLAELRLLAAFISPAAEALLERHRAGLEAVKGAYEYVSLGRAGAPPDERRIFPPHGVPAGLWRKIVADEKCLDRIYGFWRSARERLGKADDLRVGLAVLRILAPLAAADLVGLERGAKELEASGQLEEYLRAAIRAESLLLPRTPILERAKTAASAG